MERTVFQVWRSAQPFSPNVKPNGGTHALDEKSLNLFHVQDPSPPSRVDICRDNNLEKIQNSSNDNLCSNDELDPVVCTVMLINQCVVDDDVLAYPRFKERHLFLVVNRAR